MAVYFKFKSAKDYDSISIDGHFISVANLKEKIVEQKKLGRGSDVDLVISNAQTNEEYTDEGFLVPKNTSVLVRRVPGRPRMPIVADVREEKKVPVEVHPVKNGYQTVETSQNLISSVPDGLDDFGFDLYAEPEVLPATTGIVEEEDSKIRAFVEGSASDWQRQTQESYSAGRGYSKGGQGRGVQMRGGYGHSSGRGFEKKNPPHGYVCHRCGVTGHYIQHCPTNGDPSYDIKKVKPPTGIPKTMLVANPDGSYALPTGEVAVLRPNEAVFDREVDGLPSTSRPIMDIPPELCCPLCSGVLKEAVLTSKCCFKSYCDKCIRNEIITKARCVCGARNILADDLLPNRTLRDAISRFLESQASAAATSSGNVGSRMHLPDTESAPYAWPKRSSPAISISLKEASSVLVASDGSDTKEPFSGGKGNANPQVETSVRSASSKEKVFSSRNFHKENAHFNSGKEVMENGDGSPESQLTKEPGPPSNSMNIKGTSRAQAEVIPQAVTSAPESGRHMYDVPKGRKQRKVKRVRQAGEGAFQEGMWPPNANYRVQQSEMWCFNCGAYDHPSWNCYMNGGGPSHVAPPMPGPMFNQGYNPQMRGPMQMHHPMGEGYGMPLYQNPGPYNGYGPGPYDMPYNGPMVPHEPFAPHPGMMPPAVPPHRDYIDPAVMSRDEFEARKAEIKRRQERELRFAREQVKFTSNAGRESEQGADYPDEFPPPNRRQPNYAGPREIEHSSEYADEFGPPARQQRSSYGVGRELEDGFDYAEEVKLARPKRYIEHTDFTDVKATESRMDWTERDEVSSSSHEKEPSHSDKVKYRARGARVRPALNEGSSGEEISEERRYSRQENNTITNERVVVNKASGDTLRIAVKSVCKLKRPSVHNSEGEGELRIHSVSIAGPKSPARSSRKRLISEDESSRKVVLGYGDGSHSVRGHEVGRGSRAMSTKEGSRGSVFERTDLKLRRVPDEYSEVETQDLRVKLTKLGGGSRNVNSREQVLDRETEVEEGNWHCAGYGRKKRRAIE